MKSIALNTNAHEKERVLTKALLNMAHFYDLYV